MNERGGGMLNIRDNPFAKQQFYGLAFTALQQLGRSDDDPAYQLAALMLGEDPNTRIFMDVMLKNGWVVEV